MEWQNHIITNKLDIESPYTSNELRMFVTRQDIAQTI